MRLFLAALLAWALLSPAQAKSDYVGYEWITSFHSDVSVGRDGTLAVTETISVYARGSDIKRGIVRTFPTDYRDGWGFTHTVRFDVVEVTRDGKPEPYEIEYPDGSRDLKIGDGSVLLSDGEHTYVIRYLTDRQIRCFDDHDELYWNVTGARWFFVIAEATADIYLPGGASATTLAAFMGPSGSSDQGSATISEVEAGHIVAASNAILPVYNGLTIGVAFPKGVVDPPGLFSNITRFSADNPGLVSCLIGIAAMALYLTYVRRERGRQPEPGPVVPLFDPADDLSPADARMLMEHRFDDTAFAAVLINLAAHGFVSIERVGDDKHIRLKRLRPIEEAASLPEAERLALLGLFKGRKKVRDRHDFDRGNAARSRSAYDAVRKAIEARHIPASFRRGPDRFGGCAAIFLVALVAIVVTASGWVTWLVALSSVVLMVTLGILIESGSELITKLGQKRRDELEGLKMYMGTAEEGRWNALNPPELTPARFERLFPFALALNVDQAWSAQFQRHLILVGGAAAAAYAPSFFSGTDFSLTDVGSFGSNVASSMATPSSSSSSSGSSSYSTSSFSDSGGGGGSVDGGGGGGGGHGW